jgi:hypothetical protein
VLAQDLILVEECRLRLDEPINAWIPELAPPDTPRFARIRCEPDTRSSEGEELTRLGA